MLLGLVLVFVAGTVSAYTTGKSFAAANQNLDEAIAKYKKGDADEQELRKYLNEYIKHDPKNAKTLADRKLQRAGIKLSERGERKPSMIESKEEKITPSEEFEEAFEEGKVVERKIPSRRPSEVTITEEDEEEIKEVPSRRTSEVKVSSRRPSRVPSLNLGKIEGEEGKVSSRRTSRISQPVESPKVTPRMPVSGRPSPRVTPRPGTPVESPRKSSRRPSVTAPVIDVIPTEPEEGKVTTGPVEISPETRTEEITEIIRPVTPTIIEGKSDLENALSEANAGITKALEDLIDGASDEQLAEIQKALQDPLNAQAKANLSDFWLRTAGVER